MSLRSVALPGIAAAAAVLVLAGCGATGTIPFAAGPLGTGGGMKHTVFVRQSITVPIYAPGSGHRHVVVPNFATQPGVPLTIHFANYTKQAHTFTVPGLGVNDVILPGTPGKARVTTVTLDANERGVFHWYCELCPLDEMGGNVYSIMG